jgi:acyl-CoA synthetase (NDP forming)
MNIAPFSQNTVKSLKSLLPPTVTINNPLDLIAEAQHEQYEAALNEILKDKNIHSVIVILTATSFTEVEKIANAIVNSSKKFQKPILSCLLGVYDVSTGIDILEKNGIPAYKFPESAARALSEMTKFTRWLSRPQTTIKKFKVDRTKAKKIIGSVKKEGRHLLMEHESYEVLKAYHFPVIKSILAENENQAAEAGEKIGFPVVLKITSPDIIHKFDFGGVKLNLKNENEVRHAYREILENVLAKKPGANIRGVLVEEMATNGKEIIIGMNREPQFGPLLMFGMGGIYVEVLEDVTFRLAPIRELTATNMITLTKTHKILEGFRGEPVYDIEAIEDCLKRLSQLVIDFEDIKELDINPLIVYEKGKGCAIVDARIIL